MIKLDYEKLDSVNYWNLPNSRKKKKTLYMDMNLKKIILWQLVLVWTVNTMIVFIALFLFKALTVWV